MIEQDEVDKKIIKVDTYLFQNYNYPFYRKLQKKDKLAILVETRCHYRLGPLIHNVLYYLGDDWDFLFIGSLVSVYYLKNILPDLECFTEILNKVELDWVDYSDIMMDKSLFEKYEYENMFIFQTDAVLFKRIPDSIYNYDYIGPGDYMISTDDNVMFVYGGGICFRKRAFILKCLNTISVQDINKVRTEMNMFISNEKYPEHFYYSQCLSLLKNNTLISLDVTGDCNFFGQNKDLGFENDMIKIGSIHGYDKSFRRYLSYNDIKNIFHLNKIRLSVNFKEMNHY